MGSLLARLTRSPPPYDLSARPLTEEEKTQLIRLGSTAGSPTIISEAILSGNIMDPMHMLRAKEMNVRWEEGTRAINEAMTRAINEKMREEKIAAEFDENSCDAKK
jgi:hypothetical protein